MINRLRGLYWSFLFRVAPDLAFRLVVKAAYRSQPGWVLVDVPGPANNYATKGTVLAGQRCLLGALLGGLGETGLVMMPRADTAAMALHIPEALARRVIRANDNRNSSVKDRTYVLKELGLVEPEVDLSGLGL